MTRAGIPQERGDTAMMERKPYLVRLDPELLEQLRRWANEELRSLNSQIEYLLRRAVEKRARTEIEPAAAGRDNGH
jgi:hypothetical protein